MPKGSENVQFVVARRQCNFLLALNRILLEKKHNQNIVPMHIAVEL